MYTIQVCMCRAHVSREKSHFNKLTQERTYMLLPVACTKAHNEPRQRQTSLHIPRRSCNIDICSIKFVGQFQLLQL